MRSFVGFPAVLANVSGGRWRRSRSTNTEAGVRIGVHFLGRFGGEGTPLRLAVQLEGARQWAGPPRAGRNR